MEQLGKQFNSSSNLRPTPAIPFQTAHRNPFHVYAIAFLISATMLLGERGFSPDLRRKRGETGHNQAALSCSAAELGEP